MTFTESLAMCWTAHVRLTIDALRRIEAQPWSAEEKARHYRTEFEFACDEWRRGGWVTALKLMQDNQGSKHDFSDEIGTETALPEVYAVPKLPAEMSVIPTKEKRAR